MSFKEFNQQNKARAKADKEYTKSVDDLIKKNKRLKTKFEEQVTSSKDLNKELMSQLDTTDKTAKAVNRVLGVERLQVAVLENAKALSKKPIQTVKKRMTTFFPENWTKTYYQWMNNIEPWCISRQIWWGHRIPVWYGNDGKIFAAENEKYAKLLAKNIIRVKFLN